MTVPDSGVNMRKTLTFHQMIVLLVLFSLVTGHEKLPVFKKEELVLYG
jgi:hypothetical protein